MILSTNVAETSVTIDGVTCVIDSGLAKIASHSPWSGLPTLKSGKISKASATQRQGRAGRTQPGRCLRLYTQADFHGRPDHDTPEIRRADLTETLLALHAHGVLVPAQFPFFEAPSPAALEAGERLLRDLGAIGKDGSLTSVGQEMLSLPLHPRLARLVVEARQRGFPAQGAAVAALLSERDIRRRNRVALRPIGSAESGTLSVPSAPAYFHPRGPGVRGLHSAKSRTSSAGGLESDVLELLSLFHEAAEARFSPRALTARDLDGGTIRAVARVEQQLLRIRGSTSSAKGVRQDLETSVGLAVLSAFPDRVAHRRRLGAPDLLLDGGVSATLSPDSAVHQAEWMVAIDAEEAGRAVRVRLASALEPEWLIELFPDRLSDQDELVWNDRLSRVERITRLAFGDLPLEETRSVATASPAATEVLLRAARLAGPSVWLAAPEAARHFAARLSWAARAQPRAELPGWDELLERTLTELAQGRRSFSELQEAQPLSVALGLLPVAQGRALETAAPERVQIPSGRTLQVHYDLEQPPWVESRLQDFFGMAQGPSLGEARLPLVLHLLAPNGRDVQVTTDLAGFWERHYPAIRRELSRRYPRHSWPENPLDAAPPKPGGRRG